MGQPEGGGGGSGGGAAWFSSPCGRTLRGLVDKKQKSMCHGSCIWAIGNRSSKKSDAGQGGILIKADSCLLPRVSASLQPRDSLFALGGKACCRHIGWQDELSFPFVSYLLKTSLKLINVRNGSEALLWNAKSGVQGRGRKDKYCASVGRGGIKAWFGEGGSCVVGLLPLGLLFPQVRLSEGVHVFQ